MNLLILDDNIIDQVIEKCKSKKLRKTLLKETNLTLTKLLEIAQINEAVAHQSKQYETHASQKLSDTDTEDNPEEVNKIFKNKLMKSRINANPQQKSMDSSCYRCGSKQHLAHQCEATKGKTCNSCGKICHFSNVCKSNYQKNRYQKESTFNKQTHTNPRKVQYIYEESSDDEFVLALQKTPLRNNLFPVEINNTCTPVLIDSGSTVNIISQNYYDKLVNTPILPYKKNVYAFNTSNPLEITGCINVTVTANAHSTSAIFLVIPDAGTNILGKTTAIDLDLLRMSI